MRPLVVSIATLLLSCGGTAPSPARGPLHEQAPGAPVRSSATDRYRVGLGAGDPATLSVTLWLAPGGGEQTLDLPDVPGRATRRARIVDVHCGDTIVPPAGNGWIVDGSCAAVSYTVQLVPAPDDGIEASRRDASVDAERGQWLLTGASIFLVPEHTSERPTVELRVPSGVAVHHRLPETSGLGVSLPPWSQLGSVVIGLGTYAEHTTRIGAVEVRHFLDDADAAFDPSGLTEGFAYLLRVLSTEAPGSFDVFWLSRDAGGQRLTGAAGLSAIVVNRPRGVADDAHPTVRHAAAAVFFQQAFALLTRNLVPEWMALTLGQYYALRAWVEAGLVTDRDTAAILRTATPRGTPDRTVLDAFRAYDETGSSEEWSVLVRGGLAFWATLEQHLVEAGASLDRLVGELVSMVYRRDGTPPGRFVDVLAEAGGPETEALLSRWLGWPTPDAR